MYSLIPLAEILISIFSMKLCCLLVCARDRKQIFESSRVCEATTVGVLRVEAGGKASHRLKVSLLPLELCTPTFSEPFCHSKSTDVCVQMF